MTERKRRFLKEPIRKADEGTTAGDDKKYMDFSRFEKKKTTKKKK